MVFNRKPDPKVSDIAAPQMRRNERPLPADVQMRPPGIGGNRGPIDSVIGSDLSIEGQTITIRCKGSLKVHGDIQADVHSKELEVGREAIINGSIAADTVDVFGRVRGAILGAKVVLHATAQVEGDIHSQNLAVELGATFDGRSRHVKDPAEVSPQLERQSADPVAQQFETAPSPAEFDRSSIVVPPQQLYS